jgi:hypothetical protein
MSGPLTNAATTMTSGSNNNKYLRLSGAVAVTAPAVGGQSRSSPPQFRRMPSRRHQRRIVDNGASHRKISLIVFFLFLVPFSVLSSVLHSLFIQKSRGFSRACSASLQSDDICCVAQHALFYLALAFTLVSCQSFFSSSSSSTSVRIWERGKIKDYHKRSRWRERKMETIWTVCMIISLEYIF